MKYTVSVAVNGRIDVEVVADSFEEAREKARYKVGDCNWNMMELVDINPVNAEDENGKFVDY